MNDTKEVVIRITIPQIQQAIILSDVLKESEFSCTSCGETSALSTWKFIQNQWYTPPHSCYEGDYWNNCRTESCHIACPKCNGEIYIFNYPHKEELLAIIESKKISKEKLFREVETRQGTGR